MSKSPLFRAAKQQTAGLRHSVPSLLLFLCVLWGNVALAEQRFPPPDFENGHVIPTTSTPAARAVFYQYLDVAVLGGALVLATWLVYRRRSRRELAALSIVSVLYFGFWRKGCVCAIGSIQNVALAMADPGYSIAWPVVAFFVLPLAFALFGGRTFCSAVCPHGALQDLVLVCPVSVPSWLENSLGLLPYFFLGAGVLFAATGSAFIFCEYDPFIPMFRMSGRALMVGTGVVLLVLGMFVGRPYCRFACPYGALLRMASWVAKWRVRVTPDVCTQCRLCEKSCPYGAMRFPEEGRPDASTLKVDRRRLGLLILAIPLMVLLGGWLGARFSAPASLLNPSVKMAEEWTEKTKAAHGVPAEADVEEIKSALVAAATVRQHFALAGWWFGGWCGLVVGAKLASLSVRRSRTDYEPDRGSCVACARCFETCPNERTRRGA